MLRLASIITALLLAPVLAAQISVAGGFSDAIVFNPLANARAMAFAPDGRLFYTEHASGQIMVMDNPTGSPTTPTVFATVTGFVGPSGNDSGLHGIAFHPNFPTNPGITTDRYVYVCHTTGTSGSPQFTVKRFEEDTAALGTALGGSETTIVAPFSMGSTGNNFGGRIAFGPDGLLYVSVGDGGSAVSLSGGFAQDVDDRRGKVLRFNDDGTIPLSNPFTSNPMFAYGFRNPRGLGFNPTTNDLFNADSGNPATSGADELNVVTIGSNYGWDASGVSGTQAQSGFEDPAWDFGNTFDPSVVAFFPTLGTTYPTVGYRGGVVYVASEATGGSVSRLVLTGGNERVAVAQWAFAGGFTSPVRDIAFGPDFNLYVLTEGVLYRITFTGNASNDPSANAGNDQTVDEGDTVNLDASSSSDPDVADVLRYTWRQVGGGTLISIINPTTATASFVAPGVSFDQTFTLEVIVEDGNGGVDNDFVIITVQNTGNSNGGGDGKVSFKPPGEGGCSTNGASSVWWITLLGLVVVLLAVCRNWRCAAR